MLNHKPIRSYRKTKAIIVYFLGNSKLFLAKSKFFLVGKYGNFFKVLLKEGNCLIMLNFLGNDKKNKKNKKRRKVEVLIGNDKCFEQDHPGGRA
jgi:hypothetical protein